MFLSMTFLHRCCDKLILVMFSFLQSRKWCRRSLFLALYYFLNILPTFSLLWAIPHLSKLADDPDVHVLSHFGIFLGLEMPPLSTYLSFWSAFSQLQFILLTPLLYLLRSLTLSLRCEVWLHVLFSFFFYSGLLICHFVQCTTNNIFYYISFDQREHWTCPLRWLERLTKSSKPTRSARIILQT